MKRELNKEEALYRRLFFSHLHYNGKSEDAMNKCTNLLDEVMSSDMQKDFKLYFEGLWKDQTSKLYETHENWAKGLRDRFNSALDRNKL